jgi:hypothetical protein
VSNAIAVRCATELARQSQDDSLRRSVVTEFRMCAWSAAPFPLQADTFSCRVALNFNRPAMEIPSRGALFEKSVNAQGKKSPYFRLLFVVAKMDNPP